MISQSVNDIILHRVVSNCSDVLSFVVQQQFGNDTTFVNPKPQTGEQIVRVTQLVFVIKTNQSYNNF